MTSDIFTNLNSVDALLFCVFLWILYMGLRKGPLTEFFKLLGILAATFISLHYYFRLAKISYKVIALPKPFLDFLAFLFLWLAVSIIFKLLRDGFALLQGKKEEKESSQKWLSVIFATVRGFLVCCLIIASLLLLENKSLEKTMQRATMASALRSVSVEIYKSIYDGAFSKLFSQEEFNSRVLLLQTKKSQPE